MDDRYVYMKYLPDLVSFNLSQAMISSYLYCSRASDYGLLKIDGKGRIIQFAEKPKGSELKAMVNL